MSVAKIDGKWSVLIDGKVVFTGPRRDCKRYKHVKKPEVKAEKPKAAKAKK